MLYLMSEDKEFIDISYKNFLLHLKSELESCRFKSRLDYSIEVIKMLQNGFFSKDRTILFDDTFKFLDLPNLISDGAQVMYGVACCRHASNLLNDVLQFSHFSSSLLYIFIDEKNDWHISSIKHANHVTVLLKDNNSEYILDPANGFVFKKVENQSIVLINVDFSNYFTNYFDDNIQSIGKILKKYYGFQKLGIECVYDYSY